MTDEKRLLNKVLKHCIESKTNMQLIPHIRKIKRFYKELGSDVAENPTIYDINYSYSKGEINFDGVIASLVLYF